MRIGGEAPMAQNAENFRELGDAVDEFDIAGSHVRPAGKFELGCSRGAVPVVILFHDDVGIIFTCQIAPKMIGGATGSENFPFLLL
jgi:hypothetical protein